MSENSKSQYTPGLVVEGIVQRSDASTSTFILQLPGNVEAVLSWYEVTDEQFEKAQQGSTLTAVVDRVQSDGCIVLGAA